MVDRISPDDFILAGAIFYGFNGSKFIKNNSKLNHTYKHKDIMNVLTNRFPKTFTMRTKFAPRIDKSQISDIMNPGFINTIDARFFRACDKENHSYHITSKYMIEGERADQVEIDYEIVSIYDYKIYNMFISNKSNRTEIAKSNMEKNPTPVMYYDDNSFIHVSLPPIPMRKWDTSSSASIKEQIDKYTILK